MADRRGTEGMDISSVLGVLRRRILIVAVAVLAGAGRAYFVSKGQDPEYTADAYPVRSIWTPAAAA